MNNQLIRNILIWAAIFFAVMSFVGMFSQNPIGNGQEVSYTEFLNSGGSRGCKSG